MMKSLYTTLLLISLFLAQGCSKNEFLEKKPSASILLPNTLEDLRGLLENYNTMNLTPGLPQLSADEYRIVDKESYLSLFDPITRNAYTWEEDIYEGKEMIMDWNLPYTQVFYANSILKVLEGKHFYDQDQADFVKGWALFVRAHAFYQLVQNFSPAYDPSTATTDMGIPLRLKAEADELQPRVSVKETFDQIFSDLREAGGLLPEQIPSLNRNRPSKTAVLALSARVCLYMGEYDKAEMYADSALHLFDHLIDYNTIDTLATTPFGYNAEEVIYSTRQLIAYSQTSGYNSQLAIAVDSTLIASYDEDDLRLPVFFMENKLGNPNVKRGYIGSGAYPFTGLATDEMYLIKAECLARRGEGSESYEVLDELLEKRYRTGSDPVWSSDHGNALDAVLMERRKELIWRGLRWSDLKRLNKEGAGIVLERKFGDETYTLAPNEPRYVFPIPANEISLSGIQQNFR